MKPQPRYDHIADWYPAWVGDGDGLIVEGVGGWTLPVVRGARVLDVACGHGRASRGLARLGARVQGVDLSGQLLARARAREESERFGVVYHEADVARPEQWWDGAPFDGAVCEMAMMDIDDIDRTLEAVAAVLRTDGWFAISMVHPCFPGNEMGLSSWPPGRTYFDEGRWTSSDHNPDGVRLRVGSSHRTLSTYLNTLVATGFDLVRVVEPPAPVPTILLLECRRAA